MYTYELVVKQGTVEAARFLLNVGESKKGTYTTLTATPCKVLPFPGKLYVTESEINPKPAKTAKASK